MTKRSRKRLLSGSILVASLVLGAAVHAQGGFALDRFQPAPAGDRFFGVQGGDPGGHLLPRLMLLADYAYKPLVLYQGSNEQAVGSIVSNQLFLHAAADALSARERRWRVGQCHRIG